MQAQSSVNPELSQIRSLALPSHDSLLLDQIPSTSHTSGLADFEHRQTTLDWDCILHMYALHSPPTYVIAPVNCQGYVSSFDVTCDVSTYAISIHTGTSLLM